MNILFFLTHKANCTYIYDDFTIRQALEHSVSQKQAQVLGVVVRQLLLLGVQVEHIVGKIILAVIDDGIHHPVLCYCG